MTQNLGETNLRLRRRVGHPIHEFDQLPKPITKWLTEAILPSVSYTHLTLPTTPYE